MLDAEGRRNLANSFSWKELLAPAGLSVERVVETFKGPITIWSVDDDPSIRFQAFGEMDDLFLLDENGELPMPPAHYISKVEVLRRLHLGNNSHLTDKFLESGNSIVPSIFDMLGDARRDFLSEKHKDNRYLFDPIFKTQVDSDLLRIESQEEAKRRAREAKNANDESTPSATLLSDFLTKELSPERFLIEGVIPVNGTVTVVAAKKTGKSTFIYNIIHSLINGEPLLGCFDSMKVEERIGFVNYELTEEQAQDWFQRSPIGSTDQVAVWNLRGKPNPFRSEEALRDFALEVKALGVRVLILDPFSSAFRGGNTQDNDEVKDFWLRTDAFKDASGVRELIVPVHAGRDGSRSRGASALDDHPDAILHLNKQTDSIRTFHAFGRDVEIAEGELEFDKSTLLLTYKGAVSMESRIEKIAKIIEGRLADSETLTATQITKLTRRNKDDVREARDLLVSSGRIEEIRDGQSKLYRLVRQDIARSPNLNSASAVAVVVSTSSPYRGEVTTTTAASANVWACPRCGQIIEEEFTSSGKTLKICLDCNEVVSVENSSESASRVQGSENCDLEVPPKFIHLTT
jgi:hypothetical protein